MNEDIEIIHRKALDIINRFIRVRKKNENKITTQIISAEKGGGDGRDGAAKVETAGNPSITRQPQRLSLWRAFYGR